MSQPTSYNERSANPALNRKPRGPASGDARLLHYAVDAAHRHPNRFWRKVTKLNGENACWVWTSSLNHQGYGQFWVAAIRRCVLAHRISFVLAGGEIADGLCVCHHCDNPICVRPDHLFAGTTHDNIRDMVRKGRHPETQRRLRGAA